MSAALRVPQRPLGDTGLTIPAIAFGAGPVSALMTDADARDRQLATVERAVSLGVDWFDTAATYGNGTSETSLGCALRELGASNTVRIGTKVRLAAEHLSDIPGAVRASVEGSLQRLGVKSIALLQLHNSITRQRGDQPTSITPGDVLRPGGVLEAFEQLRRKGLVQHLGLTGLGDEESLDEVLRTGDWATAQASLNLCDTSALFSLSPIGGEG
ncbi:MAG: aldo/keto reductase, partial [Limisphaerales bacterium]